MSKTDIYASPVALEDRDGDDDDDLIIDDKNLFGDANKVDHHDDTWKEWFHLLWLRYFPLDHRPWFLGHTYSFEDRKSVIRHYNLDTYSSRMFVTLELSESCKIATYIYQFVMTVIILNIVANVLMTLPYYRTVEVTSCANPACNDDATLCPGAMICEPEVEPILNTIDDICVIIFTVEYCLRVFTVCSVPNRLAGLIPRGFDEEERIYSEMEAREMRDPPQMVWYRTLYGYCSSAKNLIDFVAILPFYITLIDPGNSASLSFIRILRLFRVLRAFNGGANTGVINMIGKTVKSSMEIIMFVLMIMTLVIFIYGSIIFSLESGTYIVSSDYPNGQYLVEDSQGEYRVSSLTSTFTGMYWAVITMTTVGYGDIVPYTDIGKVVAVTCAFVGLLFMALPIAILGSKVTLEYAKLEGKAKVEKEKKRLAIVERRLSKGAGNSKAKERLKSRTSLLNEKASKMKAMHASAGSTKELEKLQQEDKQNTNNSGIAPEASIDGSIDVSDVQMAQVSAKSAMRSIRGEKEGANMLPADQRKLASAAGEIEARQEVPGEGASKHGLFGKRNNVGTDAMELVINRLLDDLQDEDSDMNDRDMQQSLQELTRHLRVLGETVMSDLETDFRRMQLLIQSSEVLVGARSSSK
jgi:voltage-gated potassium channel Kch